MEYILETFCLEKRYKRFKALNNLNIHVPKGAIYGLVGKNGSGKTTLIRVICGLQNATSGTYSIYGIINSNKKINDSRKRMGAIIEKPSTYLNITAKENLIIQSQILGLPSRENVDELLKIVGLENSQNKKVKNFSLGMKQRLGIAIALIGNPDFIVLDEPINGLDPEGIVDIRELILKLNKEKGISFLISSHYLDELSKIATNYGFINNGEIIKEISRKELEEKSKKRIEITVDNIKNCVKYFEEKNVPYEVISNNKINIFKDINLSELVLELSKENCRVDDYKKYEESLENYFINLIGGEGHE